MKIIRHLTHARPAVRPRVAAVGGFDGVHLGHQRVLARVVERAAATGGEPIVVLTRQAPAADSALMRVRDQIEWIAAHGVDWVAMAAADTADDTELARRVGAAVLVTAAIARPRAGIELDIVPVLAVDGQPVSAAGIRTALRQGAVADAARRLGRAHTVSGRVIHGHHRGGPLGIPTANIRVRGIQLPPDGVYAVRARIEGRPLSGVANLGFNPTFGNRERSVETHLLDFSGDLYGKRLEIGFIERLRGERKFAGVDALLAQIRTDVSAARRVLSDGV